MRAAIDTPARCMSVSVIVSVVRKRRRPTSLQCSGPGRLNDSKGSSFEGRKKQNINPNLKTYSSTKHSDFLDTTLSERWKLANGWFANPQPELTEPAQQLQAPLKGTLELDIRLAQQRCLEQVRC